MKFLKKIAAKIRSFFVEDKPVAQPPRFNDVNFGRSQDQQGTPRSDQVFPK